MGLTLGAFLFGAAFLAGALNSVAGGGSFIALPALIFAGVRPVLANTTNTVSLWPGGMASAVGYRREMRGPRRLAVPLGAASLAGGMIGALLLLRTSDSAFLKLLPWLFLLGTLSFTFGSALGAKLRLHAPGRTRIALIVGLLLQFTISIYGGYFGGGMGVMMLAVLAVLGMTHIHEMNGLKSLIASLINGVAALTFVFRGAVSWGPGLLMAAGAIAGGYLGAAAARRMNPMWIKRFVVALGWVMTAYFFLKH